MSNKTVKVYLVAAGDYHDIDFARLELLKLLGENEKIRVSVRAELSRRRRDQSRADFLVTYTCNLVPTRRGAAERCATTCRAANAGSRCTARTRS